MLNKEIKNKRINIVTLYTGFNYGSALQAYASKKYYQNLGYDSEILGYSNSLVKGRDIRIEKLLIMFLRTFWRPSLLKKTFLTYNKSLKKEISIKTKEKFFDFYQNYLKVLKMNKKEMKIYGKKDENLAFVCGSDQIWNTVSPYIDPFYYLNFFPKNKRMAYAPSFGKNEIPNYNKKIIANYLKNIPYLSVRENIGQNIIKNLIGKKAEVLIDPTLLLDKEEWNNLIKDKERLVPEEYILCYFLDLPNEILIKNLNKILTEKKYKLVMIPNIYECLNKLNGINIEAGPLEFLDLVKNAKIVFTDSFHGMLFSINFNKPFYVFERNYGVAHNQSSRIESILDILDLKTRFIKEKNIDFEKEHIDWRVVNKELEKQREKSKKYILNCLEDIKSGESDEK